MGQQSLVRALMPPTARHAVWPILALAYCSVLSTWRMFDQRPPAP